MSSTLPTLTTWPRTSAISSVVLGSLHIDDRNQNTQSKEMRSSTSRVVRGTMWYKNLNGLFGLDAVNKRSKQNLNISSAGYHPLF